MVFNCNIHHNVYCDVVVNGSFTKEITEYSSYLIGRAEMLSTFPFNKLAVSCDLLLKTRFLIFTIVTKTNIYQIKCNQRKTNERNNSARNIKPSCLFKRFLNLLFNCLKKKEMVGLILYPFLFKMFR